MINEVCVTFNNSVFRIIALDRKLKKANEKTRYWSDEREKHYLNSSK